MQIKKRSVRCYLLYLGYDSYLQYVSIHRFEVKMFGRLYQLIMLDEHINDEENAAYKK